MNSIRSNPLLQLILAIVAFMVPWGGIILSIIVLVALRDRTVREADILSKIAWILALISIVFWAIGIVLSVIFSIVFFPFRLLLGLF